MKESKHRCHFDGKGSRIEFCPCWKKGDQICNHNGPALRTKYALEWPAVEGSESMERHQKVTGDALEDNI